MWKKRNVWDPKNNANPFVWRGEKAQDCSHYHRTTMSHLTPQLINLCILIGFNYAKIYRGWLNIIPVAMKQAEMENKSKNILYIVVYKFTWAREWYLRSSQITNSMKRLRREKKDNNGVFLVICRGNNLSRTEHLLLTYCLTAHKNITTPLCRLSCKLYSSTNS